MTIAKLRGSGILSSSFLNDRRSLQACKRGNVVKREPQSAPNPGCTGQPTRFARRLPVSPTHVGRHAQKM